MDPGQVVQDLSVLPLAQLRTYCELARTSHDLHELGNANAELDRRFTNMQMDFLQAQQSLIQTQGQVASMSATLVSTSRTLTSMQKNKGVNVLKFQPPAKFNGDVTTLRTWLFAVRQYFVACGLTDQSKMQQFAATLLEGNALIWWESQCTQTPQAPLNWTFDQDLVPALQKAFRDLGYEQRVLAQFENWSAERGETMAQYIARYRQLCTHLSQVNHLPDETTLVHKFTQKLVPDARFWFGVTKPPTIADAYQLAEDWAAADQMRSGNLPKHVPQSTSNGQVPMDIDSLRQQIASLQLQLNTATSVQTTVAPTSSAPPRPQRPTNGTQNSNTCFRCGRNNHVIRSCRARYHINGSLLPSAPQQARGARSQQLRWISQPDDRTTEEQLPSAPGGHLN